MRTSNFVTAATLLRSPYHVIYALPLLFLSVLLLFAGTFLTLDRTRTFARSPEVKKAASFYRQESGIGGLAIGWVLAVHMTTLIALLILNYNETSHLSAPAFLVVWFLSAIVLVLVCGRWKYAALVFGGILGGVCTGLILSISLQPSLLARLLLTLIAVVMLTGGALLPIVRHASLRIATSATGATGIINACAILGSSATNDKLASWTNAWLHLVLLHDSDSAELQWGNGKSKGLTAACYFLWMIGAACDWYLKRRVGQDSEAWNNDPDSYTTISPPEASRIGLFTSIESYWTSLKQKMHFSKIDIRAEKSFFFPSSSPPTPPLPKFHQNLKAPPVFRPRMPGAFTPDPYYSDSDSDLGDGEHSSGRVPYERKWTVSTNHSYTNLVNPEGLRRQRGVDPSVKHRPIVITSPSRSRVEYGDKDAERSPELNLGPHRIEPSQHNENWRPVFLERSDSLKAEIVEAESRDVATMAPVALYSPDYQPGRPELAHIATPTHTLAEGSPSTPRLVPATPPLIKTLDSVSRAQSRTYSGKLAGDEFESDESARETPSGNRIDTHKMVMEQ